MNSSSGTLPLVGDVWSAFLDPVRGHEQGGDRPVIVISADWFNESTGSKLVIVVPLTRTDKPYPTHVQVSAEQANLRFDSWAMCEQVRALSIERFKTKRGTVLDDTLSEMRTILTRILTD